MHVAVLSENSVALRLLRDKKANHELTDRVSF